MNFIISLLPMAILVICLLIIKLPAKVSSIIAFVVTLGLFIFWFKPEANGIAITLGKGAAMGVYVGLIAFGAMLLYKLVDLSKGFDKINNFLSFEFDDKFVMFLMLSWTFSAFLQGIAGYGLPPVITVTILMSLGFDTSKSAASSLLGHSWAITFGSMGSSIFAIDLVTQTELGTILIYMSKLGSISMLCCGLGVCFIYGGVKYMVKGLKYIIPTWITMTLSLYLLAKFEMVSIIGFITGIVGVVTIYLVYRLTSRVGKKKYENTRALVDAVLPYILVIALSILFNVLNPKLKLSLSFKGYITQLGVKVAEAKNYVTFNIFKHPFMIILMTVIISIIYYLKIGKIKKTDIKEVLSKAWKKIKSTEITLIMLLCTAQMMMDSSMTTILSQTLVNTTGGFYGFVSAFIGMIGAFITGSNTNANILFGSLQENAAISLGLVPAFICAVQTVAASVGGAIGPTTTALCAATAGKSGKEGEIYKYTLLPTLIIVVVIGIMGVLNLI